MTTRMHNDLTALIVAALTTAAGAQTEILQLNIAPNTTYQIDEDILIVNNMTVGPGATIEFLSQGSLTIGPNAFFVTDGNASEPVTFKGVGSYGLFQGITFQEGSIADIEHTDFIQCTERGLAFDGSYVNMSNVSFAPAYFDRYATQNNDFVVVRAQSCAWLIMDRVEIAGFYAHKGDDGLSRGGTTGGDGLSGDPGRSLYAVRVENTPVVQIINSRFQDLDGGEGGRGGNGAQGVTGADGDDGGLIDDGGHDGSIGLPGGDGGNGGSGGKAYAIYVGFSEDVIIAQNVFHNIAGGQGGAGGSGGKGGTGGRGGDGTNGVLADGGDGGNGGPGGRGGNAGYGGASGTAYPVYVAGALEEHTLTNNTFLDITTLSGGSPGSRGARGSGGAGGRGGSAGTFGDAGSNGSTGISGAYGSYGSAGLNGAAIGVFAAGVPDSGYTVSAHNNAFLFNGLQGGITFRANTSAFGIDDATIYTNRNASSGQQTWNVGDVIGSPVSGTVAFDTAYTPAPNATALIDAGISTVVPSGLTTDYNGNPRFMDDPATPNTGFGPDQFIVDIGAVEFTGWTEPCPADVNGDGILDNGDLGLFVSLFLAGDAAADFTGDGVIDNGDIGAFVAAYLAGC